MSCKKKNIRNKKLDENLHRLCKIILVLYFFLLFVAIIKKIGTIRIFQKKKLQKKCVEKEFRLEANYRQSNEVNCGFEQKKK